MNGKPWTQRDTEILRRMAGKYTCEEIAATTGHATITVRKRAKYLDLPACHRIDWTLRGLGECRANLTRRARAA